MAEIEYELREQDLLAFNDHQLRDSEKVQKTLRRHQAVIPGIITIISFFLWLYYQDTLSAIYVGLLAVGWGLAGPWFLKWQTRRQVKKLYTDEVKEQVLGTYKLRIEPKALIEVGRNGESRIDWGDVLRVEATKQHAFIFVGLDTALIIPKSTVKSGNLVEFVKEADALIEKAA